VSATFAAQQFVMANYTYNYNYNGKRINLAIDINFEKPLEDMKIIHGSAARKKGAGCFKITLVEKRVKPAKKPAAEKAWGC
jgi:hypothetical protein